jgi:hypothetical protein
MTWPNGHADDGRLEVITNHRSQQALSGHRVAACTPGAICRSRPSIIRLPEDRTVAPRRAGRSPLPLDVDGEALGSLPLTVSCYPATASTC